MKNHLKHLCLLSLLVLFMSEKCPAKNVILFVVEENAYNALGGSSGTLTDIQTLTEELDGKLCPLMTWAPQDGNNYMMCNPLFVELQNQYVSYRNSGHVLEGVILIGNIPVPMLTPQTLPVQPAVPVDQVYMDLTDGAGQPYITSPYRDRILFRYVGDYKTDPNPPFNGDKKYEIWISRIDANFFKEGIREGGEIHDEYSVYQNYLDRWYWRLDHPATVPSRGFIMGGVQEGYSAHSQLGVMRSLNLSWMAEFEDEHNTSFNWASQLLAGPRGCITYGAYNNTLFPHPNTKNERFCRYNYLPIVYEAGATNPVTKWVEPWDSLGWEWAGIVNHSCSKHSNFYDDWMWDFPLQGSFSFGTPGPYWGNNFIVTGAGYLNSYHYWVDQDWATNPYNYGCNGKFAEWRYIVPVNDDYNISMSYTADPANCDSVAVQFVRATVSTTTGLPTSITGKWDVPNAVNQRVHTNVDAPNFEIVAASRTLAKDEMLIIRLNANHGCRERHIADAVKITPLSNPGAAVYIDDTQPADYTDYYDHPSGIFTTEGFFTSDEVLRAYEDLSNESGGGGSIKSQFYTMAACNINEFTSWRPYSVEIDKCIGNLYALGENGLICMGTAGLDHFDEYKTAFFESLAAGLDFGEAFLAQQNGPNFLDGIGWLNYQLLGAGSLRSQPYIQYGSQEIRGETYNSTDIVINSNKPIFLKNVTVNGNGGLVVTSTHTASSPVGTYAEVKVRESTFSPTGSHVVQLIAN